MMIKGVLLDLSGVLYVGQSPVPGAVESLARLVASDLPILFLTNTTRRSRQAIHAGLVRMGFNIRCQDIFTASTATLSYLAEQQLRPHLLIHPELESEYQHLDTQQPNCVVLGDAADKFNYQNLNTAFRILMQDQAVELIAMGDNRYFRETAGLSLDQGPFIRALEYASGRQARITGKPAADFFLQGVKQLGCRASEVVMIGDDVYADVEGALKAGLRACLVKTGKYQPGDENQISQPATYVADDFNQAVDWLLRQ